MNATPTLAPAPHLGLTVALSAPIPAGIIGLGHALPERILTNVELATMVETNDEWIRSRTGIAARRIAAEGQTTADLAFEAAKNALEDAQISSTEIDLIIVATCTPDFYFPSTAALVQDRLGASCGAFDLQAACSGFVYSLVTAVQFVGSGAMKNVLVVGAEVMSRIVDWTDRNTCILFGDGAGAAIVSAQPDGYGLLGFDLGANGAGGPLLKCPLRVTETESAKVFQNGREVYKFAVHAMGDSALRGLEKAGLTGEDVDVFVPHQANIRIINSAAEKLGLPTEKVFLNIEKYGNTSAASIPIALSEAKAAGVLNRGGTVVTTGFGAGLTWATAVLKWF